MNNLDQIELPDLFNIEQLDKYKKESDAFYTQFQVLAKLGPYDKLAIDNNILYIQKITPWRYFVRKYKKQNRLTLSTYFNIEIAKYNIFLRTICSYYINQKQNKILNKILVQHYDLLNCMDTTIKNLRDKYNLKINSSEISLTMENSYNIIVKLKRFVFEQLSQENNY
jgi:hypothetical protein